VNLGDPITSGIVGVTINGGFSNPLIGFSASLPWIRSETNIDLANTWTKILGNHTVKFGVDLRRVRDALLQEQTFSPRGLYTFNDGQTALNTGTGATVTSVGNNFGSFLVDVPGQAGRDLATFFPNYRAWQFFSFVQDKWLVSPKLTADLGLRWDSIRPPRRSKRVDSQTTTRRQHASRRRIRGYSRESRNHYALQIFRPSPRTGLSAERIHRHPRGVRHQLYAFPGQQLCLQFPGPLEQRLQSRSRQFWPGSTR